MRLDAAPSGNINNLFMALSMDPFRLLPKYQQPTSHANKIDAALSKNINTLELVRLNPCKTKMMQCYPKYRHLRTGVS